MTAKEREEIETIKKRIEELEKRPTPTPFYYPIYVPVTPMPCYPQPDIYRPWIVLTCHAG